MLLDAAHHTWEEVRWIWNDIGERRTVEGHTPDRSIRPLLKGFSSPLVRVDERLRGDTEWCWHMPEVY